MFCPPQLLPLTTRERKEMTGRANKREREREKRKRERERRKKEKAAIELGIDGCGLFFLSCPQLSPLRRRKKGMVGLA